MDKTPFSPFSPLTANHFETVTTSSKLNALWPALTTPKRCFIMFYSVLLCFMCILLPLLCWTVCLSFLLWNSSGPKDKFSFYMHLLWLIKFSRIAKKVKVETVSVCRWKATQLLTYSRKVFWHDGVPVGITVVSTRKTKLVLCSQLHSRANQHVKYAAKAVTIYCHCFGDVVHVLIVQPTWFRHLQPRLSLSLWSKQQQQSFG